MPVPAAMTAWRSRMQGKPFVYFGDNEGARFCFSRGYSQDNDLNFLVGLFWLNAAHEGQRPWFARVASDDNPTDSISRRDMSLALKLGWRRIHPDLGVLWQVMERGLVDAKLLSVSLMRQWAFPMGRT